MKKIILSIFGLILITFLILPTRNPTFGNKINPISFRKKIKTKQLGIKKEIPHVIISKKQRVPQRNPASKLNHYLFESLTLSAIKGDPLTPAIDRKNDRRFIPSKAALNDPVLYEEEEEQYFNVKMKKMIKIIPQRVSMISRRIKLAQKYKTKTPEEIEEAEEAMDKLLSLKKGFGD